MTKYCPGINVNSAFLGDFAMSRKDVESSMDPVVTLVKLKAL